MTASRLLATRSALRNSAKPALLPFSRSFNKDYVPPPRSTRTLMIYSIGLGSLVGAGLATYHSITAPKPGTTQTQEAYFVDTLPDVKITRKLHNARDQSDLDLVLFQYQTCPFCCKVN